MGQLFSKKNKEVFSTPLGLNNPVTVQVLGICSAFGCYCQTGACHCDGSFSDGDYSILQCSDFTAAQDDTQPYPYHRSAGGCCRVGNYCK